MVKVPGLALDLGCERERKTWIDHVILYRREGGKDA
jgi:hypothetical protein